MAKKAKGLQGLTAIALFLCLGSSPALLFSYEKKLRVTTDYAHVYLQPDETSLVIGTLERGSILSLLYSGKTKKVWYYVCFKSEKTGATKSGYILDSVVEPLYDVLKTITIREEKEDLRVNYTPRNFDEMQWGVSKKYIVEMEGKPSFQTRFKGLDIMRYEQKVINLDCAIEYVFASNKLSSTKFYFQNNHLNKNAYLEDYQRIKDALIQRFGRPLEENLDWRDTANKENFSSWGEAISLGQLELSSRWLTSQTEIQASLTGEDEEINLIVEYTGLQLKEVARKSQQE